MKASAFHAEPASRKLLAIVMAVLFAAPLAATPPEDISKLKIIILQGDDAVNTVRQRVAQEPVVEVRDENDRPVAGAVVVFSLPGRGAGASFVDGASTLTVTTDPAGRATATGLTSNGAKGSYQIRVTASSGGESASATITQSNVAAAGAGGGGGTTAIILGIVAAAAAGGILAATGGGDGGSPAGPGAPPTPRIGTISAGTPTVGAPQP